MRITVSKKVQEERHAQAVDEVIALAKETAANGDTKFVYDYSKFSSNFYMHAVARKVSNLTEETVTGGNNCHDTRAKTYIFYIKEE